MNGLMMQKQLLISSLIVHADRHHGDTEIVSRRVEGDIHRYTFRDCHRRARQMASALTSLGPQALRPDRHAGREWAIVTWSCTMASPAWVPFCTPSILACMKTRSLTSLITPKTSTSSST